jgi:hypothetical protein
LPLPGQPLKIISCLTPNVRGTVIGMMWILMKTVVVIRAAATTAAFRPKTKTKGNNEAVGMMVLHVKYQHGPVFVAILRMTLPVPSLTPSAFSPSATVITQCTSSRSASMYGTAVTQVVVMAIHLPDT